MAQNKPAIPLRTFIIVAIVLLLLIAGGALVPPLLLQHHEALPFEEEMGDIAKRQAASAYNNLANPLAGNADAVRQGQQIYLGNCALCHGTSGKGDSPLGQSFFPPAANLMSQSSMSKSDGQLYWFVENGISFTGMPSWKSQLNQNQIWQVVTYIRALQQGKANTQAAPTPTSAASAPSPSAAPAPSATTAPAATSAAATPATAAPTSTAAAQTGNAQNGKALFQSVGCATCHGDNGEGGKLPGAPKLAGTRLSFNQVQRQVRNGGGAMPAFSQSELSDDQLRDIYAWLTGPSTR